MRKKKSIMLPVSTFAFQSATLLPSQRVDAGSLLISLSTDGIANTRHGDLDRKKKKRGKEKVIIIIVTIKGKNRKSSESRPRASLSSARLLEPRRLRVADISVERGHVLAKLT